MHRHYIIQPWTHIMININYFKKQCKGFSYTSNPVETVAKKMIGFSKYSSDNICVIKVVESGSLGQSRDSK